MWLPHGTAADVSIEMLQAQMYLCKYDDPYKWKTPCKQVRGSSHPPRQGTVQLVLRLKLAVILHSLQSFIQLAGTPAASPPHSLCLPPNLPCPSM